MKETNEKIECTLSLNLVTICKEVYALSALRHVLDRSSARPELLTKAHEKALKVLAAGEFGSLCRNLGGTRMAVDEQMMSVDMALRKGTEASDVRVAMEEIVCLRILAQAYAGSDRAYSTLLGSRADCLIEDLRDSVWRPHVRLQTVFDYE